MNRYVIILSLILVTFSSNFAVTELKNASPEYINKTYLEAVKLFEKQDYEGSLNKIRHVIKSDMHNYKLRYLAAHNHWRKKNYEPARQHFLIGISQRPLSYHGYIDLSLMYIDQYNYNAAKLILNKCKKKLIKNNKHVPAKLYNIQARIDLIWGNPHAALKKSQAAKASFQKKNTGVKDQLESLLLEGRAYLSLNEFSKAEFALSWGLSLRKRNATVLNLIGYTFEQWSYQLKKTNLIKSNQKRGKAIEYYKRALATSLLSDALQNLIQKNLQRVSLSKLP